MTREALLRRSSTLPPVAVGDTSQYSSLRLKFLEHEQRLYLPIECFDLLEREIFALRQARALVVSTSFFFFCSLTFCRTWRSVRMLCESAWMKLNALRALLMC